MAAYIDGYHCDIPRGLWERVQVKGAPRAWVGLWIGTCAYLFLIAMATCPKVVWAAVPILWLAGQLLLVGLTKWDWLWDHVLAMKFVRGYQDYSEAP